MEIDVEKIRRELLEDGRYPLDAYEFVRQGLGLAVRMFHGDDPDEPRHVTGQQLCEALRRLALQRWGLLAPAVLRTWHIYTTRDFGEIVFKLVELGMLGKQDSDRIEDFDDLYRIEAIADDYRIPVEPPDRDEPDT